MHEEDCIGRKNENTRDKKRLTKSKTKKEQFQTIKRSFPLFKNLHSFNLTIEKEDKKGRRRCFTLTPFQLRVWSIKRGDITDIQSASMHSQR